MPLQHTPHISQADQGSPNGQAPIVLDCYTRHDVNPPGKVLVLGDQLLLDAALIPPETKEKLNYYFPKGRCDIEPETTMRLRINGQEYISRGGY